MRPARNCGSWLLFAASTGARAGEQWAIRWRDVNFDKGELQISRRVDVYGDEGAPKSTAGVRTVPLSRHLAAMLTAWKLKSQFSKSDDLIFPNREGHHLGHDNLTSGSSCRCSICSRRSSASVGMASDTSRYHAGSRQGSPQRRCRPSPATRRCKSQWTDTATCSRATTTAKRWTRLPRDYLARELINTPAPMAFRVRSARKRQHWSVRPVFRLA
jgi:hypothetical protein